MYYDYVCYDCEVIEEVNHGMTEDPVITCYNCGKPMKRAITGGSGTHFKGNGWAGSENKMTGDFSNVTRSKMTKRVEGVNGEG